MTTDFSDFTKINTDFEEVVTTDWHELSRILTTKELAAEGTESAEGFSVSLVYSAKTARKASFVTAFCLRPQGQFLTFF